MADFYIRMSATGTPLGHVAATDLPFENGKAMFVAKPKGRKEWFKKAALVEAVPGPGEDRTGPFYEGLTDPLATIRYATALVPPPPSAADLAAATARNDPFAKALLARMARAEGKTVAAIVAELQAELP